MQKNPAAISWFDTFLTEILQRQMKSKEKDLFIYVFCIYDFKELHSLEFIFPRK